MKNNPKCLACKSENIELIFDYTDTKVVTSDNKTDTCNFSLSICKECSLIQKDITQKLVKTIDDIYTNYESYYLTDGKEEISFDGNQQASTRSINIVNNIEDFIKVDGNILDVGAGKGVFLKEFSKRYDRWNLYSQDIKDNLDKSIKKLPNFQKSFFLEGDNLPQKHFDIISTIHVFEHIFDIDSFIKKVKSSLKSDGLLLIQVPYLKENIFDVFIIDHLMHFILNKSIGGADADFSLDKKEFSSMIKAVRDTEKLLGKIDYSLDEKKQHNRRFCRSLYVSKDIKKGDIFTNENIKSVRPGYGTHPKHLKDILGTKAQKDYDFADRLDISSKASS
jgi:2-polyprenyl-3-methyl-5-hydroxy-6-metoxy-1,4-benzoquinol methylase